jgi:hypothetical protein
MKNELMISPIPSESEFNLLQIVSRNAAACGLYTGVGSEQKIFMVLLAARELGIMPMQALNGGIWNIQGKIEISSRLMNAMIRRAGHSIKIVECNGKICILEGTRADNNDTFRSQFTIEDAHAAGLANRPTWKAYAEDMLYSRAMSRLARRLFSDVIGTAYVEGEIRDATSKKSEITHIETEFVQDNDELIQIFCERFPDENPELISEYLFKYMQYWGKTLSDSIKDYAVDGKFILDFNKWSKKEIAKKIIEDLSSRKNEVCESDG